MTPDKQGNNYGDKYVMIRGQFIWHFDRLSVPKVGRLSTQFVTK